MTNRDMVADSLKRNHKYLQQELQSPQPEPEYVQYLRERIRELRAEYMRLY